MNAISLIRTVDRVETPAVGRWTVAPNQPAHATRRGLFRRATSTGWTVAGALVVNDDDVALDVSLRFIDPALTLRYRTTAVRPTVEGAWLLDGDLAVGATTRPQRAIVRYRGVYRFGGRAVAWLTFHAATDLAPFTGRRRRLDVMADLNAEATVDVAAARRSVEIS